MAVRHPRFATLAKEHGFQPSDVSSQRFGGETIEQKSIKMELVSECSSTNGKKMTKKLLKTMEVTQLKALIGKVFKIDVLKQKLAYTQPEDDKEWPIADDARTIDFYGMEDGGKIFVRELN